MSLKKFTRKEIAEYKNKKEAVFIVNNSVYDVTSFLEEHPGGHEVLLNVAGTDGSEEFADVGHSLDAKELREKYKIGEVVDHERQEAVEHTATWDTKQQVEQPSFMSSWKFPVLLGLVVTLLYSYLFG